jgi:hypothetical protein
MLGLTSISNILVLDICLLCTMATVVAIPLGISAASASLYRWRRLDESRVGRSWWLAMTTRPLWKSAVLAPSIAGMVLGGWEVEYFLHYRGGVALICIAIGILLCSMSISFTSYLALLVTVSGDSEWSQVWKTASALVARSAVVTLPLFVAETVACVLVGRADPGLVVIGLPVVLLWSWQWTAVSGCRRAGLAV